MGWKRTAVVLGLLCTCLQLASAQQFWEKKPYAEWSDKEVRRIMESSPWAQQYTVSNVKIEVPGTSKKDASPSSSVLGSRGPSPGAVERGMEQNPRLVYTVQFRSAKPMRQALIRRVQIDRKYDQMDAAKKAESDRRAQEFLEGRPEEIMVYVGFETNVPAYALDVQKYFTSLPPGTVPIDTYLNVGGQKLSPTSYRAVTGGMQLTFSRPASIPQDGEISLEFISPQIGDLPVTRAFVPFNLKKMVLSGAPEI